MAGPADAPGPWKDDVCRLGYRLGERTLFSKDFRGVVLDVHHTRIPEGPVDGSRVLGARPRTVQLALVSSQPVTERLPRLRLRDGCIRYVPAHFSHYTVALRGGFDDYLRRLPAKARHELRRKERRAGAAPGGAPVLSSFRGPADMDRFLELARGVSRLTYQERLLGLGLPEGEEFRRDVAERAARGAVRGYLLEQGGRPAAYGYLVELDADPEVLYFHATGYDPAQSSWSPGILLLAGILRDLFAEGRYRILDLGQGDARYKRQYATDRRRCANVYYFRRTARNLALVGLHAALLSISDGAARVLSAVGAKDAVKRFLRRRG